MLPAALTGSRESEARLYVGVTLPYAYLHRLATQFSPMRCYSTEEGPSTLLARGTSSSSSKVTVHTIRAILSSVSPRLLRCSPLPLVCRVYLQIVLFPSTVHFFVPPFGKQRLGDRKHWEKQCFVARVLFCVARGTRGSADLEIWNLSRK